MREKQRNELHKTIWSIANELRGSVDGWDFKAYVLITLFYRFISEDITSYINAQEAQGFDYATLDDETAQTAKEALIKAKGYFIAPSELFSSLVAKIKNDSTFAQNELNQELKRIFQAIEGSALGAPSERNFKFLFDDFKFNDKALGNSLIEQNLLHAVIGLPANLFFGTSIPACILIFKRQKADKNVLFIDASKDYEKGKNQNKLLPEHIDKILRAYNQRQNVAKYAHLASFEEIKSNDFNLNIPRYVEVFDEEELIDLNATKDEIAELEKELSTIQSQMNGYLRELGL